MARRDPGRRDLVRPARRDRPACRRTARPRTTSPTSEQLRADDVRYAYVEDRDVLHGIDLDLEPGERVAVVGPSGAGKSTLGRLLAGIHPPREGRVEVGGVRLVDLPLDTLRREVALVTQEQHVFVGTLAENLRLARPSATEEQLVARWRRSTRSTGSRPCPRGLDTVVGAGGHPLTPAQAQQLALARLVLADPHTLVLDEATSLLDPRAARHLERSLASVLSGRTVVAIAHRLHTAHDADRVAVVEDGLLHEVGTHDELVARGRLVRRALGLLARRPLTASFAQVQVPEVMSGQNAPDRGPTASMAISAVSRCLAPGQVT